MASIGANKSTTVRSTKVPWSLRAAVRLGSLLAPQATARRAMRLFCTPMASSRSRAMNADTAGAQLQMINTRGGLIQTYLWGDPALQPLVLFSHGWSSFGLRCVPWVARLRAAGYAVLSFDQPGHGRNAPGLITLPGFADTVLDVGSHYGPFAAAIGHSLGGAAVALAMRSGMRSERAVLIAPAADGTAASRRFAQAIGLPEHRRAVMQTMLEQQTGRGMDSMAIHRVAPELAQPALIIHDLADHDVPWDEGERYARYWSSARLLSVEGLGHHKIVTAPMVIDASLAFLAGELPGERVVSTHQLAYGYA